jgi:D-lyxose ketol-isomerase
MNNIKQKALSFYEKANIVLTEKEKESIEIAEFGLGEFETTGLILITYVNTDRCCAKEMVLLPDQTCPEHLHPSLNGIPGKEETFRCRWGKVYLYVDGEETPNRGTNPPENGKYSVFHEVILLPGQQYTIYPNTKHWFKAGHDGAVISEFSTHSNDATDIFTDERIIR